jgi:iron complex transport system substrate-binding protein
MARTLITSLLLLACTWPLPVQAGELRVVSQTAGSDELLLALADPVQVAALSHLATAPEFCAVAKAAAAYPQISTGDSEAILRYRPTLVLFADYSRAELIDQVRKSGVQVIIFDHYATMGDVYANLRALGRALGHEDRAEKLIAACKVRMTTLAQKLKGVRPVRVINASTYGILSGADTTFQDLCDHAGAENLAGTLGGITGIAPEPTEKMLAWPVDVAVLSGDQTVEEALAPLRDLLPYKYIPAVQEGRAVILPSALLASVTHHRITGYELMARALHPEVKW